MAKFWKSVHELTEGQSHIYQKEQNHIDDDCIVRLRERLIVNHVHAEEKNQVA